MSVEPCDCIRCQVDPCRCAQCTLNRAEAAKRAEQRRREAGGL